MKLEELRDKWALELRTNPAADIESILWDVYDYAFEDGVQAVVDAPEDYGLFAKPNA